MNDSELTRIELQERLVSLLSELINVEILLSRWDERGNPERFRLELRRAEAELERMLMAASRD